MVLMLIFYIFSFSEHFSTVTGRMFIGGPNANRNVLFSCFLKTNTFYKNAQEIRFCGGGGGANTTKAHFVKQEVIEVPDIDVDKWAKGEKKTTQTLKTKAAGAWKKAF